MNIEKKIEEFIYKFRCCECGKLLGGVNKKGFVGSLNGIKHYTSLDGNKHIFECQKCHKKNEIDVVELRKKLRNKNYQYYD